MKLVTGIGISLALLAAGALADAPRARRPGAPSAAPAKGAARPTAPYCSGEYADDLAVLPESIREREHQPQSQYTYCVRSTAVYECLSYGADGNVRHVRKKATAHGTAFAYKQQSGETYLLTNQHVAEWPAVTDEEHPVEDVPSGCKRVSDSLKIVEKESDAYERDDIPLSKVVADPQLDVAVLKARQPLQTMPWKIGRSAALRERNVVDVRGFPLGAFQATNVGKVISAYDHDDFKDWDHDDFVIDALLSPGNSGSPVLAVSCKTGEFELVGVYHAGYSNGSALNVVVGIDQVRDLMTTLKRNAHPRQDVPALDASARARLLNDVQAAQEPFFGFGPFTASVRARADGALVYEVYSKDFPLKAHPVLVLEDLAPLGSDAFGDLGRIWFGGPTGLKVFGRAELEADAQSQVTRAFELLRHDAVTSFAFRAAAKSAPQSREKYEQMTRLERTLKRNQAAHHDASQAAVELADRFGPHGADIALPVSDAFTPPEVSRRMPPDPGAAGTGGVGGTDTPPPSQ